MVTYFLDEDTEIITLNRRDLIIIFKMIYVLFLVDLVKYPNFLVTMLFVEQNSF